MKIGIVATVVDSCELTGVEKYAIELIRNIPKDIKNEIIVLCHRDGNKLIRDINADIQIKVSPYKSKILTDQIWIPVIVRQYRLDFVYNISLSYPWLRYGRPFAFMLHDATPWRFPDTISQGMKFYYLPQIERQLRSELLRGIITPSYSSGKDITSYCNVSSSMIYPIHLGVDKHVFKPVRNKFLVEKVLGTRSEYILAVGTVEPRKNLQMVIDAFEQISLKNKDLKLAIVGRQGWAHQISIPQQLLNKVIFTGYISLKELVAVYSMAQVLVFPSLYEGFGFPLVEAMCCGTPVIASNVSSLPEIGGDACLYVDPNNVLDLVKKIDLVLSDNQCRLELIERGLVRASNYSWANSVKLTWSVLEKLC